MSVASIFANNGGLFFELSMTSKVKRLLGQEGPINIGDIGLARIQTGVGGYARGGS